MLRSGLSFDDWSGSHTLNQNGNYLFVSGQNAAARDPLAHVMGLAWAGRSAAGFVLEVLNATLLKQKRSTNDSSGRPAGSIMWGIAAFGEESSASFNQSDIELAALFTLAQYALATRGAIAAPVWEAAWASFQHLKDVIGTGEHGLIRLLHSDHNDGLLNAFNLEMSSDIMEHAESVMNGGLAAYVLPLFAQAILAANTTNATSRAAAVMAVGNAQRAATAAQWVSNGTVLSGGNGTDGDDVLVTGLESGWYRRAWMGTKDGWRGSPETDGTMWTETQSWALLGQVPQETLGRTDALITQISRAARDPSPIGAINTAPDTTSDGGVGYGGVWQCGTIALITALGLRGAPDEALSEWRKSSLTAHANAYPNIWFGVTSGADVWNSVYAAAHNGTPGSTRCQWNSVGMTPPCEEFAFPILNMWSHTLGTYTLPALIGVEWNNEGMILRPPVFSTPGDEVYTIFTPLVSVSRGVGNSTACAIAGHYAPFGVIGDHVQILVQLMPIDAARCNSLSVNNGPWENIVFINNGTAVIKTILLGNPPIVTWQLV